MALAEGLDHDAPGAIARATADIEAACQQVGIAPDIKLTAAFADGERLLAVRYASKGHAPTLYCGDFRDHGRCIVSEPFDRDNPAWQAVPPSTLLVATRNSLSMRPFEPMLSLRAVAV